MMTKDEKQELFLYLIESWFEDYTGDINKDNCIGFYHYLLDCLDFELNFGPEPEHGFHKTLYIFTDFLYRFPEYQNYIQHDREALKRAVVSSGVDLSESQIENNLRYIKTLFFNIKDEYFL